ncbi:hypothetical protein [Vibrio sp. WXL103]|uniref:hypothetical protein n=1 Tax=unclassified Vibrio TaxID=2614977 RepID=UPI0030E5051D
MESSFSMRIGRTLFAINVILLGSALAIAFQKDEQQHIELPNSADSYYVVRDTNGYVVEAK